MAGSQFLLGIQQMASSPSLTVDILVVIGITLVAVILFIVQPIPLDVTALLVVVVS